LSLGNPQDRAILIPVKTPTSASPSILGRIRGGVCLAIWMAASGSIDAQGPDPRTAMTALVSDYCAKCHDADTKKGELNLESVVAEDLTRHPEVWEKVARRLRARQMPPAEKKRPTESAYQAVLAPLERALDEAAAKHPNAGRTDTVRRLNRTEYQNAIRDLLALDIDAAALLPKDDASHGFDNVTLGALSPTLLDRYLSAAEKISRLAVGAARPGGGDTIRVRADLTQEEHVEGLPLGTRGGALIPHTFPQDAEYEIQIRLARDRNEEVEGLHEAHSVVVLLDRKEVQTFTVAPPKGNKNFELVDQHLKVRVPVKAGPHQLGVTFVKNPTILIETKRQPYDAHFNMHRHPRQTPAIYQVSINGPYAATGPGDTPSRRRVFTSRPTQPEDEERCAKEILSALMRKAYRRPATDADLETPMEFFRKARAGASFDAGIEAALSAVLVSPNFLFRIEQDPPGVAPKTAYQLPELELASRLSFFLWSSLPDEELLALAARGELHQPEVLEKQARRMLADARSHALITNFAGQWLYLRNLESFTPDLRLFPDFDDNLRQAFRQETELFFESVLRDDRSVLDLVKANYTFLNERLARHYGISNVYGSRFRRVATDAQSQRGGLLRQGSILAVTSYANRTSPVLRGHWVLANLIGTPPPPPPGNAPALKDNAVSATLSVRERLTQHRADATCAHCHNMMDPVGFSLENFDAVGRWRAVEEGKPVDVSGGLPDGQKFAGVSGLEEGLLRRPELFAGTLAEKLLTYALGRGMETYDGPAIRRIVAEAQASNYRFSSIIVGVVKSVPFTMRNSL
jgi:hypothetical protein